MKLVREFITLFEKFTEDSDAVQDMGIGMPHHIEQLKHDIIARYVKDQGGGGTWFKPSPSEIKRITEYDQIARFITHRYQEYGVDLSIAMLNYLSTNKFIDLTKSYLIYVALQRGRSIKKRRAFIEGLINIGARVKEPDITYSMQKNDDKMTRFLIESAMQQKRGKFIQNMLNLSLTRAMKNNKVNMILWLFEKGADPAYNKYLTLRWALENNQDELVKFMLEKIQNDPKYK